MTRLAWIVPVTLVVLAACGGLERPRQTPALLAALDSADPSERAWAVSELSRRKPPEALPGLVARLRDEDGGIRLIAGAALRDWTGQDLGFRPFESAGEREAAVIRWEEWLASNHGEGEPP